MEAAWGRRKSTMPPLTAQAAMMLRGARVEVLTAAQAVSKAANIEPDFAATIGAADYMNNLEATFNLGVLFPLIGAFIASIYARVVYIKDDASHFQMPDPAVHRSFWFTIAPNENRTRLVSEVAEPFAAACNMSYLVTGLGFFFLQFFSGAPLPEQAYGMAIFMLLLGATSAAFHMDASRTSTWQHHADRFGMYCLFAYMACIMLNGLFHAMKGAPASPRSCCSIITNIGGCFWAVYFLVQQETVHSFDFLVGCGFIIFTCNGLIVAFLHARAQAAVEGIQTSLRAATEQKEQDRLSKGDPVSLSPTDKERRSGITARHLGHGGHRHTVCCRFCKALWLVALPAMSMQLVCLAVGFYQNLLSSEARDAASSFPYDGYWVNGTWTNGSATIEWGLEMRMRHDILHGSWHVLTCIAISIAGQSLVMGLSGRLDQPEMMWHWGELAAAASGWLLSISNLYMTYNNVTAMTILNSYLAVSGVSVPILIYALYCQVCLHNELVQSGVPLSQRTTHLIGMGLPKWRKSDWHPREIVRSSIASMDPNRMREDLAAEGMITGGVPMPPKRYGSVRMAPQGAIQRYSVNPAFFSLPMVAEESAVSVDVGASCGTPHFSDVPSTSSSSPARIIYLASEHDSNRESIRANDGDEGAPPSIGPEEWT